MTHTSRQVYWAPPAAAATARENGHCGQHQPADEVMAPPEQPQDMQELA